MNGLSQSSIGGLRDATTVTTLRFFFFEKKT